MSSDYPKLGRVLANGLTVREEFAMRAMAVKQADELIFALNKPISAPDAKQHLW